MSNDSEQRRQIHSHTHTLDMESLILKEAGFTGKSRDIIDAIIGAVNTRTSPQIVEVGHLTLARRLNHPSALGSNKRARKAAITYVARKLDRLEREMRETGFLIIRIERGHEEKKTRYEVFLTPVANRAYQRAYNSDLWKENPSKAKSAQVAQAIEELPRHESKAEESNPKGETDEKMIKRNLNTIASLAQKTFDALARKGDSPTKQCEELSSTLRSLAQIAEQKAKGTTKRYVIKRNTEGGVHKNVDTPPVMLAAALEYAARGIPVFPVKADKSPHTAHGFKDATTDEGIIREQWGKYPQANIGVPTGEASGWLVIDIDPRHGGNASWSALIAPHVTLPPTREARTGGGGHHIIFDYPKGSNIRNSAGKLGQGIDVRGEGGFVVVAPSLTSREYQWLNNNKLAQAPEWLLKRLTEEKQASTAAPAAKMHAQAKSAPLIGAVITEGGRNDTLFRIGCAMRGQNSSHEEIESYLFEVNSVRCSPQLPDDEVRKIAESVAKYPANSAKAGMA